LEEDDGIREEEDDNDFIDSLGSISSSSIEALEAPEAEVEVPKVEVVPVPKKRGKGHPAKKDLPVNNISGSRSNNIFQAANNSY
jgi:hypothetical protein